MSIYSKYFLGIFLASVLVIVTSLALAFSLHKTPSDNIVISNNNLRPRVVEKLADKEALPSSDYRSMGFVTQDSVELVLWDSQGNSMLDVIENAYYVFEAPYGDPTGVNPPPPLGVGTKTLHIPRPPIGLYVLEVSGSSGVDYIITIFSSSVDADSYMASLSGTIQDGSVRHGIEFSKDGSVSLSNLGF